MNKIVISVFILFSMISCKEKESSDVALGDPQKIIISEKVLENGTTLSIDDEDIEIITEVQLEKTPVLIGLIWSILNIDNYFYIFDKQQLVIHIFNKRGQYISSINQKGKGPNEYVHITDLFIDSNNNIVIYDFPQRKLLRFNKDGTFLHEQKVYNESGVFSMMEYNGSTIFITGRRSSVNEEIFNHDIYIRTSDNKIIPKLKNEGELQILLMATGSYFIKNRNNIYLIS